MHIRKSLIYYFQTMLCFLYLWSGFLGFTRSLALAELSQTPELIPGNLFQYAVGGICFFPIVVILLILLLMLSEKKGIIAKLIPISNIALFCLMTLIRLQTFMMAFGMPAETQRSVYVCIAMTEISATLFNVLLLVVSVRALMKYKNMEKQSVNKINT